MKSNQSRERVVFANNLRAIAPLLVLISHWFFAYWAARPLIAGVTMAVEQPGAAPHFTQFYFQYFNFGALGVAIFFLISGFVIPFSLSAYSTSGFLAARALRIFPTYAAGLAISWATVWLSSIYWHKPLWFNFEHYLANAFLINILIDQPGLDLVNWTLAIEVKFYIFAALFSGAIIRAKYLPFIAWAAVASALNLSVHFVLQASADKPLPIWVTTLARESTFVGYMLIGTVFYYQYIGAISKLRALGLVTGLFIVFCCIWAVSPIHNEFPWNTANYAYAIVIFAAAYACRDEIHSNRLLDWLSGISYPLYVVHAIVGYVTMRILLDLGVNLYIAMAIASFEAFGAAALIHKFVEVPSTSLGKRLANALTKTHWRTRELMQPAE
jgi:peptidoglycan/LPS O-acetylase OafA/YrhL